MAELTKIGVVIDMKIQLTITEDELKALDALFGYGVDSFLETFYTKMGRAYLQPHEAGLRSLVKTLRGCKGLASEAGECREFMRLSNKRRFENLK